MSMDKILRNNRIIVGNTRLISTGSARAFSASQAGFALQLWTSIK